MEDFSNSNVDHRTHWNPKILLLWRLRSSQVRKSPFKMASLVKDLFSSAFFFYVRVYYFRLFPKTTVSIPKHSLGKEFAWQKRLSQRIIQCHALSCISQPTKQPTHHCEFNFQVGHMKLWDHPAL